MCLFRSPPGNFRAWPLPFGFPSRPGVYHYLHPPPPCCPPPPPLHSPSTQSGPPRPLRGKETGVEKKKAPCYTGPYSGRLSWTTPKRQRDSNPGLSPYWTSARPTVLGDEGTTNRGRATKKQSRPTLALTLRRAQPTPRAINPPMPTITGVDPRCRIFAARILGPLRHPHPDPLGPQETNKTTNPLHASRHP